VKAVRRLADASLYFFIKGVLQRDLLRPSPHRAVCDHFQKCYESGEWCSLTMPRDFFKSTVYSEGGAVWITAKNPNRTVLLVTNTLPNARAMLGLIRQHWERNKVLRALYPEVLPDFNKTTWGGDGACLRRDVMLKESTYECAGVRSTLVGRHYTDIIADDLIAGTENVESGEMYEPTREDIMVANTWLDRMAPLFKNPQEAWFCLVGTRWCEDDAFFHTADWGLKPLEIDAIDERGEPTFELYDLKELERREKMLGPYLFSALYRNRPMAAKDRTFKAEWIEENYIECPMRKPDPLHRYFLAVDPASTRRKESDYTALLVVGADHRKHWYVVEYENERMGNDIKAIARRAVAMMKHWGVRGCSIEVNHYRGVLKQELMEQVRAAGLSVRVVEVQSSIVNRKDDRILWLQPLFKGGMVHLQRGMNELESQLLNYRPGSDKMPHDDLIDALGMIRFVAHPGVQAKQPETWSPFSGKALMRDIKKMRRSRPFQPAVPGFQEARA